MGVETKIQWTDHTFNPWRGCTKISPGCANCYAETMSHRNPGVLGVWGPGGTRVVASELMWKQPLKWDRAARAAGVRRRVFCASLADVFELRADLVEPRARLFGLIAETPNLDWLLLTKRPAAAMRILMDQVLVLYGNSRGHMSAWEGMKLGALDNVWLGVSVEDQKRADERIPALLEIPAAVRFLSVEPMLGPVDLSYWLSRDDFGLEYHSSIDWVIVGGESGHGARPCDLAWIRSIRDMCRAGGAPVFVKQIGSNPVINDRGIHQSYRDRGGYPFGHEDPKGGDIDEFPPDLRIREFPAAPAPVAS